MSNKWMGSEADHLRQFIQKGQCTAAIIDCLVTYLWQLHWPVCLCQAKCCTMFPTCKFRQIFGLLFITSGDKKSLATKIIQLHWWHSIYLLPAWINPSQGRGQPLRSFFSTSFDHQYVLSLIRETSCLDHIAWPSLSCTILKISIHYLFKANPIICKTSFQLELIPQHTQDHLPEHRVNCTRTS